MNELKLFLKKTHWMIIPALLAALFVGSGVLLLQVENNFESVILMPFVVLGVFYKLLLIAGMGVIGSFLLMWAMTFFSIALIYIFVLLLVRAFVPMKNGRG